MNNYFLFFISIFFLVTSISCGLVPHQMSYYYPSEITDYNPVCFSERSDKKFFYSILDELKYSDALDFSAKTLFKGQLDRVFVSPDNQKALIVSNERLWIVTREGAVSKIVRVSGIHKKPKPIGTSFFRDDDYQWSKDSKSFFLIKDTYYSSIGSQLYSEYGILYRYTLQNGVLEKILEPFKAYHYFFDDLGNIYFSTPNNGDLLLKKFDGNKFTILAKASRNNRKEIKLESPFFFSFNNLRTYEKNVSNKGFRTRLDIDSDEMQVIVNDKVMLQFSKGNGLKGTYYGFNSFRSMFLPGDKYFLLNVATANHGGQILIEVSSGKYKALPKDTRIYPIMNTLNFHDYKITGAGIRD